MVSAKRIAAALLCLAGIPTAFAGGQAEEEPPARPIESAVMFDAGSARNLDTYLSPIRYTGFHTGISYEYMRKAKFDPKRWMHNVDASLGYDNISNPAGNNTMHSLLMKVSYGMLRKCTDIAGAVGIYAGWNAAIEGGITYNPRNSNNVCSPQIYAHAGLTGIAEYEFRIGSMPVTARYKPSIPVIGSYYLPDYDQTFYEIYLGNYKDAVNFGWWGNRFDMENLVTLDFNIGHAALRIGYRNNFTTLWKNNISVQHCTHSFVLGIAWEAVLTNLRKSR